MEYNLAAPRGKIIDFLKNNSTHELPKEVLLLDNLLQKHILVLDYKKMNT